MKKLIAVACFVSALLWFYAALQNRQILQYMDEHPDPRWVPDAEYYLGSSYYLFQNLPEAATYFIRVPQRYPKSKRAEAAYWAYLQTLEDDSSITRSQLIDQYAAFLERYPDTSYREKAQNKVDSYKSGAR